MRQDELANFTTILALSADGMGLNQVFISLTGVRYTGGLVVQYAPCPALRCFCIFEVWKRIQAVFCGRR
ncbi:hypothetical protein COH59_06330 [Neisseria meningitidis]|nr:hypothetical protein COH59_06330 [Neisseria meningitidis]